MIGCGGGETIVDGAVGLGIISCGIGELVFLIIESNQFSPRGRMKGVLE